MVCQDSLIPCKRGVQVRSEACTKREGENTWPGVWTARSTEVTNTVSNTEVTKYRSGLVSFDNQRCEGTAIILNPIHDELVHQLDLGRFPTR
jgi:hypothetical protein